MTATLDQLRKALERIDATRGPMRVHEAAGIANDLSPYNPGSENWSSLIDALQGDLNAVVALIEREMPGICMTTETKPNRCEASVWWEQQKPWGNTFRNDRNLTLALLAAILRAKIADAEAGG